MVGLDGPETVGSISIPRVLMDLIVGYHRGAPALKISFAVGYVSFQTARMRVLC
jgi:hypothetical protein